MSKRKEYPLQIIIGEDWCYSKGHHDPKVFIEAANKEVERIERDDFETNGSASFRWLNLANAVNYVKQDWRRVNLSHGEEPYEYWYEPVDGPGRFRFPLTSLIYQEAANAELSAKKTN